MRGFFVQCEILLKFSSKAYSVIFIVYLLFLLFGVLCASFLITGAKLVRKDKVFSPLWTNNVCFFQRKPNYLSWWLIYQGAFIVVTAGIVILVVRMKDERFGLLSYLKNYVLKIIITLFVSIYLIFLLLLLYFFLSILSLRNHLRKGNERKSRQISAASRVNLTEEIKVQGFAGSAPIQMIPLSLFNQTADSGNNSKESGKYFILHVWEFLKINIFCIKSVLAI